MRKAARVLGVLVVSAATVGIALAPAASAKNSAPGRADSHGRSSFGFSLLASPQSGDTPHAQQRSGLLDGLLGQTVPTLLNRTPPGVGLAVGHGTSNGHGVGLGLPLGPLSVSVAAGRHQNSVPKSTARPVTTKPAPKPAQTHTTTVATPASSAHPAPTVPQTPAAASTSAAPKLAVAPMGVPSLAPQHDARGAQPSAPAGRRQAAYPTTLNDIADGTAMLIGVLIIFMIGVISVVVSAGYRSRRANHRAS